MNLTLNHMITAGTRDTRSCWSTKEKTSKSRWVNAKVTAMMMMTAEEE